jgi:superfamily I DNA/RNA helicase
MRQTVYGPPGTGKTTHLISRVAGAVEKYGRADAVVVMSLTKAAATEIKARLALEGIHLPDTHCGTMHSIGYALAQRPGMVDVTEFNQTYGRCVSPTFGKSDDEDGGDLEGHADDLNMQRISLARARGFEPTIAGMDAAGFKGDHSVTNLCLQWETFKDATGTVDYADMIDAARELGPPKGCRAIIYDEAQDGSRSEFEVLKRWASAHGVEHTVIAGDDDQALYTWRGASVEEFLNFGQGSRVLDVSWRLPRNVWLFAEQVVRNIKRRAEKPYSPREDAADGVLEHRSGTSRYVDSIMEEAHGLAMDGNSVMVLAQCGYMLKSAVAYSRQSGIAIHNPYRKRRGDWCPLKAGSSKVTTVRDIVAAYAEPVQTFETVGTWLEGVDSRTIISRGGKGAVAKIAKSEDATRALTPDDWHELIVDPRMRELAMAGSWDFLSMSSMRSRRTLNYAIHAVSRGWRPTEDPRVILGTIHSVKGGEADYVFLLPDVAPSSYNDGDRDAVVRTFYVGATRAKKGLFLCSGKGLTAELW